MILFIKKRYFIFIVSFMILSVIGLGVISFKTASVTTSATGRVTKTIILDAGHGEPDGGAVGLSGVTEADLNLEVAKNLQKLLKKDRFNVIMTRTDEKGIFDESLNTIKKKKVSDMHNREKIMNSSGGDIFLSIHMNKFTDSKYSGPQVFYSPTLPQSENIADRIQKELISQLEPEMEREIKKADNSIYLLKQAQIPAVLVECGFLSNIKEEKLLSSDEYQEKIAKAIYKGITAYFQNN